MAKLTPKRAQKSLSPAGIAVAALSFSLVMVMFALPTFLIIIFGLAPTWAAFLTDQSFGKARGFAVGTFNLAGATPFFVRLWSTSDDIDTSIAILSNPYSWLIMYGAAALSLTLIWVAPSFTTTIMEYRASVKRTRTERRQQEIIENWGEDTHEQARVLMVEHGYLRADEHIGQSFRIGSEDGA